MFVVCHVLKAMLMIESTFREEIEADGFWFISDETAIEMRVGIRKWVVKLNKNEELIERNTELTSERECSVTDKCVNSNMQL